MSAPTNTLELNADLAKEVRFGVEKTFSALFGISPEMGALQIAETCTVDGDVCGLMKLVQDRTYGALYISFPRETIFGVVGKLFRKQFTEFDTSVRSGVGEITNSIFGVLKGNLNKRGFHFKLDVPDVILGGQGDAMISGAGRTLVIPFSTDYGPFTVMITIYPQAAGKADAA